MNRKKDELLPIEAAILRAVCDLRHAGTAEAHGFQLAKRMEDAEGRPKLVGHGTLYKALSRMEKTGLLASRWEASDIAEAGGRPRRRLYTITALGERALASNPAVHQPSPIRLVHGQAGAG